MSLILISQNVRILETTNCLIYVLLTCLKPFLFLLNMWCIPYIMSQYDCLWVELKLTIFFLKYGIMYNLKGTESYLLLFLFKWEGRKRVECLSDSCIVTCWKYLFCVIILFFYITGRNVNHHQSKASALLYLLTLIVWYVLF